MRALFLLLFTLAVCNMSAQRYDPLHPPDTFRNADNPMYWRNRPPFEGYWQQDVAYRIKARLDEVNDRVDASATLRYWNNSPDTLRHVFFHLYQEAFTPGSYMNERHARRVPDPPIDREKQRGTEILSMTIGEVELQREQDNTIVKVQLPEPLAPGSSVTFTYTFRTTWAMNTYGRMKLFNAWGYKHFDGVHWYPRISVYDRKAGWDTQQHLGNEFYGNFGTFTVDLDMPNDMVVEATGWLQNPAEVMPADLRAKLDLRNFATKPYNEAPSVITPYDPGKRKVWRYHAENVHDFAFTADPTYRIGETEWRGIKCIAVAQEPHAAGWQNAAAYCARVIEAHSLSFGMYAYPKMVVADARDGMEYPMLTLDSGRDPDYRGLLVHEIGHNWFYGMVANNETYRALLDEGFTQFLTSWGLEYIDGDTLVTDPPTSAFEDRYLKPRLVREEEVYRGYMRDAVRDELPPINVHSDEFDHVSGLGGGYGHVYYKTATMLYNLQYVLGDELFLAAMRDYFERWKFCHPTVEDFRECIIRFTKTDLNWFFDQWIDTDKRIDYAVKRVIDKPREPGQTIHLRRKGSLQMPIDLKVIARDGRAYDFHIPNTWFVKQTDATVLPRWTGWGDLRRDYYAKVDIPTGILDVRIDTTHRLADAYHPNNSLRRPVEMTFDHHLYNPPDRLTYEGFVRPDIWWNGFDGMKIGVHFHGDYLRHKHKVWFTGWLNTGIAQRLPGDTYDTRYDPFNFNFRYENGTEKLLKGSSVNLRLRHLDGLQLYGAGFQWRMPNGQTTWHTDLRYMLRRDTTDLTYLLFPDQWEVSTLNGVLDLGVQHRYSHDHGDGDLRMVLRNSAPGAESSFAQLTFTALNKARKWGLELRTRVFGTYGSGNTPRESALYLAGASPEEMMENKYVRSIGFVPYEWLGYGAGTNHFHHGGGLGLRGYAGYLAPTTTSNGQVIFTHFGNTGASLNAELDLDGLVNWRPGSVGRTLHVDIYLFGDIGTMGYRTPEAPNTLLLDSFRADAGVGGALTIKRWWKLTDIKPLTIRFDMPLYISNVPAADPDGFVFRYVVGIGRTF
ncbi:MAG: M1 family metallopeptidase [Flavobacteriales bacterium]|nr:M1 family metallopeptidase [Flavobacteriales bacterium]